VIAGSETSGSTTSTDRSTRSRKPSTVVTVAVTSYEPGSANRWKTRMPVAVPPSPNDHSTRLTSVGPPSDRTTALTFSSVVVFAVGDDGRTVIPPSTDRSSSA
jgi:hypothetical protein